MKKILLLIIVLFLLFPWVFALRPNAIIVALVVAAIIYVACNEKPREKEELKIVNNPTPARPATTKQTQPKNNVIPIISQFEKDTKIRIQNNVKRFTGGEVEWDQNASICIRNRHSFSQKILVGDKRYDMKIEMNANGPAKLIILNSPYQPIILDKNLIVPKVKEPKKTPPKNKPKKPVKKPEPLSNAEKAGNVNYNKDGKPVVKPNYRMIASDWVNQNLEYLNKSCNDAMNVGSNIIEALLAKDKLPADREAWEAIGAMLKEQDEIDAYTITDDGIVVTIE